jgi:hypothetical protein
VLDFNCVCILFLSPVLFYFQLPIFFPDLTQEHNLSVHNMIKRSLIWFQAISLKENQLVGNVSLDLEVGREDAPSPVRVISPKQENTEDLNENKEFEPNMLELDGREDLQSYSESQESLPVDKEPEDLVEASLSVGIQNEDDIISSLNGISSYEDFLERLDQDLSNIEAELLTILKVSTLILDSNETGKNSRVQETLELLEGIRGIRKRYAY